MKVDIQRVECGRSVILKDVGLKTELSHIDEQLLKRCMTMSSVLYQGKVDGMIACMWGLIPPTLLSTQAYLWLYTTELVEKNKFLFVRHSQVAMEQMLEEFPTIVGHASIGNDRAIRWLKWLGATFREPKGQLIPFEIRAKDG